MGSAVMVMMRLVTGCDQSTSVALFGNRLGVDEYNALRKMKLKYNNLVSLSTAAL
jgi:hypothetical protein